MRTHTLTNGHPWVDSLENAAAFSDAELAAALERLKDRDSLSIAALAGPVLAALADAARELPFRPARFEVGKPERRVYQQFGYCDAVPEDHPVFQLGPWMQWRIQRALERMPSPPIAPSFTINDIVCQEYRPGDLGITPHRDHVAYTGLIILVVLCGRGRYAVCKDRQGHGKRVIPSAPGRAILMPGPGYAGRTDRPLHTVGDIRALRYSVGLRHDTRKTT